MLHLPVQNQCKWRKQHASGHVRNNLKQTDFGPKIRDIRVPDCRWTRCSNPAADSVVNPRPQISTFSVHWRSLELVSFQWRHAVRSLINITPGFLSKYISSLLDISLFPDKTTIFPGKKPPFYHDSSPDFKSQVRPKRVKSRCAVLRSRRARRCSTFTASSVSIGEKHRGYAGYMVDVYI